MRNLKYIHPKKYIGVSENAHIQLRTKQYVERNCLKCDKFCGTEHDFEECNYSYGKGCDKKFQSKTIYQDDKSLIYESEGE